ncbi:hypothetical protein ABT356_00430 [Streptosporangium roseum]
MDIIAAYREVGTYRGAAEMCGTTHKTVKRITAVSLLDRLLHYSVVVVTEGESFRMKQARTWTGGRLTKK